MNSELSGVEMACALQLSPPFSSSEYYRSRRRISMLRRFHLQNFCYSSQSNLEENQPNHSRNQYQSHLILVERYGNGSSKRFVVDDDLQLKTFLEEHRPTFNESKESQSSYSYLYWLPDIIKDFILPAGFPGSVSEDYLQYMSLQFPTNITGWICHALVTSSLLKAVGLGSFSGSTAAASAAAIRWVSKDGIGALGRLFIGGRFGNIFDDDPKQWRLYADFIGSAGSIFDLTTPFYPAYFLPLASLGNLTKAVARGLKDPSNRVIQNHFAISGNMGEVAAKEEVWEVVAQLLGLALGILILDTPSLVKSYPVLGITWMGTRLLHLWLRYLSLSTLKFNTINLKRARMLAKSYVLYSNVPGCVECNKEENILLWETLMKPRIVFGVPLEEILGGKRSATKVMEFVKLYKKEQYILALNRVGGDFEVFISFKVGASGISVLKSVLQTYWLHENWNSSSDEFEQLVPSLFEMENKFEDFIQQLHLNGWDVEEVNLKVPREISIEELGGPS